MSPKEKRKMALDYAQGVNCSKTVEGDEVEIADHFLSGFNRGYKLARDEIHRHLSEVGKPARVLHLVRQEAR